MVLSRPFLNGTMMFSSISPEFERNLKEELYGCFAYVGIPFDILDRMPTKDRKFYISKHNEKVAKEREEIEGR